MLACLVAAAGLSPSASAAPPEDLVFEASRSAWTEIEVKERLVFSGPPRFEGGGRTAGIAVELVPRRTGGSQIVAVGLAPVTAEPLLFGFTGELLPGRYRVVMFGEQPLRVVVPLGDPRGGRLVRPTRAVSTLIGVARTSAVDGVSAATARIRAVVPSGSQAFLFRKAEGGTRADQSRLCATVAASCPVGERLPALPSPLPRIPLDVPESTDSVSGRWVLAEDAPRDAVTSLDGARSGVTTLLLGSLSYRLR